MKTTEHAGTQRTDNIVMDGDSVMAGYCSKGGRSNM